MYRMNLCSCAWQCGSAWQCVAVRAVVQQREWYERQCVAVCTVVCAQCARQSAAVFLVVYCNACVIVRLSGSAAVQQCAAVCGIAAVWGSAHSRVRLCVTVCGSEQGTVWQLRSMYIYKTLKWLIIDILVCPYRGNGNEPNIPHILIHELTNHHLN
jgi:hypothetical protein